MGKLNFLVGNYKQQTLLSFKLCPLFNTKERMII